MKKLLLLAVSSVLFAACSQPTTTSTTMTDATPTAPSETTSSDMTTTTPSPQVSDQSMLLPQSPAATNSMTFNLMAQNNSGQTGMAVISPTNTGKVNVVLTMQGGNFTQPQPAHIHLGSCPNPGAVKYPLSNVVNGKSDTDLAFTIDDLKTMLASNQKYSINVHKSAADMKSYTACVDLN